MKYLKHRSLAVAARSDAPLPPYDDDSFIKVRATLSLKLGIKIRVST
jgi:hypothetical protein